MFGGLPRRAVGLKIGTLCYIRRNGRTLMMFRDRIPGDPHLGKWNGLGGKMEPGETPEECVIREVMEESGLALESPVLRGFLTFPAFEGDEDWYVFLFEASSAEGEPGDCREGRLESDGCRIEIPSPRGSLEGEPWECREGRLEWIEDSRIPALPLWEGDHLFMKWMEDGRFFSGRLAYGGGRLVSSAVVFHPREAAN